MNSICVVCNSTNLAYLRPYVGISTIFLNKSLMQCKDCQMAFADPMPTLESLDLYNDKYFESAHGGLAQNITSRAFFSGMSKLRIGYIENYITKRKIIIKKVLEIGPGHGYFANNWLAKNPDNEYYGLETDKSCHESLMQIGVKVILPDQINMPHEEFDLVVISHVLEHVSNPVNFLESVTNKLKKNGLLFIEVPCSDWQHKEQDEPHLLFFDKKALSLLLDSTGFQDIELNYYGKTIESLLSESFFSKFYSRIKVKIIQLGIYRILFMLSRKRTNNLSSLEWVMTKQYNAYTESIKPAWWLRSLSIKK